MAKRLKRSPRMWVYSPPRPPRPPKPKVPEELKAEVTERAEVLLEEWRREHIKPPPPGYRLNYTVELYSTWFRGHVYFCAKYACPGPRALSPSFETRFTRLEYVGEKRFNIAFRRHTGQWVEIEQGLTIGECTKAIRGNAFYQP